MLFLFAYCFEFVVFEVLCYLRNVLTCFDLIFIVFVGLLVECYVVSFCCVFCVLLIILEIFLLVGVVALSQLFLICFFIDVAFRLL